MLRFLTNNKAALTEDETQKRNVLIRNHHAALLKSGKSVTANVLTTERYHPDTTQLSQLANNNTHTCARTHKVMTPREIDVREIRVSLKMSRTKFSNEFGFNPRTVEKWEQAWSAI